MLELAQVFGYLYLVFGLFAYFSLFVFGFWVFSTQIQFSCQCSAQHSRVSSFQNEGIEKSRNRLSIPVECSTPKLFQQLVDYLNNWYLGFTIWVWLFVFFGIWTNSTVCCYCLLVSSSLVNGNRRRTFPKCIKIGLSRPEVI